MIRIDLRGSYTASHSDAVVDYSKRRRGSPICDLARVLIASGRGEDEPCEVWRGETLCFASKPLGFWASRYVSEPDTAHRSARFQTWRPMSQDRAAAMRGDANCMGESDQRA